MDLSWKAEPVPNDRGTGQKGEQMQITNNQSFYINPNTRTLTTNLKNTGSSDKAVFGMMSDQLNPVEDLEAVLKTPMKLASSSSINRQSNSVTIAAGSTISINDGYVLTIKPQGIEVSGGTNPYNQEARQEAQDMAGTLSSLLRNAGGTMNNVASSSSEYEKWTENVSDVLGYMGIDTSKDFTVNGMKYSKNENGWFESEASSEAKQAYEQLKANNRTYEFADERTKKQIAHMSNYYLGNTTEELQSAWQKTLEETGINPFPAGYTSTLAQMSMEQDFATGGNDQLFGTDQESNVETVQNILDRIDNPLGTVTDDMQGYLESEKTFYIALMNNLQK